MVGATVKCHDLGERFYHRKTETIKYKIWKYTKHKQMWSCIWVWNVLSLGLDNRRHITSCTCSRWYLYHCDRQTDRQTDVFSIGTNTSLVSLWQTDRQTCSLLGRWFKRAEILQLVARSDRRQNVLEILRQNITNVSYTQTHSTKCNVTSSKSAISV